MGPKGRGSGRKVAVGIFGAPRYDSDEDSDFNPEPKRSRQPVRSKRKASKRQRNDDDTPSSSMEPGNAQVSQLMGKGGAAAVPDESADSGDSDSGETFSQRQLRLAAQKSAGKGRKAKPRGKLKTTNTVPSNWDQLPTPVLAKIFLAVCSTGALPMAPRLASVCTAWSAAVAETPELWETLDTQYISAATAGTAAAAGAAGHSHSSNSTPQKRKNARADSSASPAGTSKAAGHAAVNAGLRGWALSGRLEQLQDLRVACAGSTHLSLEDPQFFEDEERGSESAGGASSGVAAELSGDVLVLLAEHCKHVKNFSMSGSPAFKAEDLTTALLAMHELQQLRLSGIRIVPVAGLDTAIRRVLDESASKGLPALTHLVLESCPLLGSKTIKGLLLPSDHPQRSTAVAVTTAAALADSPASPSQPAAAAAAGPAPPPRPAFPHLLELDLSCSGSAVGGGIELQIDMLQAAMPLLRVLKLSGLGGFYGWTASPRNATNPTGFPHLHTLHLGCAILQLQSGMLRTGSSSVTDSVLLQLAGKSLRLADLDISGAHVTPAGLSALAASIAAAGASSPQEFTEILAAQPPPPAAAAANPDQGEQDAAAAAPAAAVGVLPLKRLHISRCNRLARDEGLQLIGQLCSETVEDLLVRNAGSAVGDAGIRGLRGCLKLNTLDITGSSVTEDGLRDLLSALPMGVLETLEVGSCRSLSRGARQAAAAGQNKLRDFLK